MNPHPNTPWQLDEKPAPARSELSVFVSNYCGSYYGIEGQAEDESDFSFQRRVAGLLRARGHLIEAHEVLQGARILGDEVVAGGYLRHKLDKPDPAVESFIALMKQANLSCLFDYETSDGLSDELRALANNSQCHAEKTVDKWIVPGVGVTGLLELAHLGEQMRRLQTLYFQTRTPESLRAAKDAERQFDSLLGAALREKALREKAPRLFDDE